MSLHHKPGTTQTWLSWAGGHLKKHLYKTTKPNLDVIGRFLVFIPTVNVL